MRVGARERATIAVLASHVNEDPKARTAAAGRATPGSISYWIKKIHEEHPELSDAEVTRRAGIEQRLYMTRLSFKSSRARQARKTEQST